MILTMIEMIFFLLFVSYLSIPDTLFFSMTFMKEPLSLEIVIILTTWDGALTLDCDHSHSGGIVALEKIEMNF